MSALPAEHPAGYLEIAVQEQETSLADNPSPHIAGFLEYTFQEQETAEKALSTPAEPILGRIITVGIKPSSYGGTADYIKVYIEGIGYVDTTNFRIEDGIPKADLEVSKYSNLTISRVGLHHTGAGWSDPTDVWIWDKATGTELYHITATSHTWDSSFPNYFEYVNTSYTIDISQITPDPSIITDGIQWLRTIVNVIQYVFKGKAYLWDGGRLVEWKSPGVYVVHPVLAATEDYAATIGGLQETGDIENELVVYGQESYQITADRNYLALIVAGDEPVQIYDAEGNVKQIISGSGIAPLLEGWKAASRKMYSIILLPI